MKRILLIILLFCFLSCSGKETDSKWLNLPITIRVETSLQRGVLDFYNSLFPNVLFFKEDPNGSVLVKEEDESFFPIGHHGMTDVNDDAGYIVSGTISISSKYYSLYESRPLFAHELMHLLGYRSHDKDGLMRATVPLILLEDSFGENLRQWLIETYELDVQ